MRRRSLVTGLLLAATLSSGKSLSSEGRRGPIPAASRQLLLVRAASWSAAWGTLQRYERDVHTEWAPTGAPIPINLGRNGLAWGRGLHASQPSGPRKTEGDGKSPSGVFALERAFGGAPALPEDAHGFPYLEATPSTYCVEDVRSERYNQIIDASEARRTSWEKWSPLKRADGLFDWAVVVAQNQPESLRGAGSCVFLHIWRGPRQPTSGCTAMARSDVESVLRWLDPDKKPALVQLPEAELQRLRDEWALP